MANLFIVALFASCLSPCWVMWDSDDENSSHEDANITATDLKETVESAGMTSVQGVMLGAVFSRVPEIRAVLEEAIRHGLRWLKDAQVNLANPRVATQVLGKWLGMHNPAQTPKIGPLNILYVTHNERDSEMNWVISLVKAAEHVFQNAIIESGIQDDRRNDCISNEINVEPYAYTTSADRRTSKQHPNQFQIYLCSNAVTSFDLQVQHHHVHHTLPEQVASMLVHEAFHLVTEPAIKDQQACIGKNNASWCAACDPAAARDNGFNYQHMVSHAAKYSELGPDPIPTPDCRAPKHQHSHEWLAEQAAGHLSWEHNHALVRAKLRLAAADLRREEGNAQWEATYRQMAGLYTGQADALRQAMALPPGSYQQLQHIASADALKKQAQQLHDAPKGLVDGARTAQVIHGPLLMPVGQYYQKRSTVLRAQ